MYTQAIASKSRELVHRTARGAKLRVAGFERKIERHLLRLFRLRVIKVDFPADKKVGCCRKFCAKYW